MPALPRMLTTAGAALGVLLATMLAAPASAATVAGPDRTSAVEARRVDSVPTPELHWASCYGVAECTKVAVPLDYDQPRGEQVELQLLRVTARDRAHRIGSLFVNPGGPGGSASQLVRYADYLFPGLRDRFDIVGMDPRGIAMSQKVRCWPNNATAGNALAAIAAMPFPYSAAETDAYLRSSRAFGQACSDHGLPLSASMSTAQVARDMDVVRRAVGDSRLSYLGFSYGTYLGQVYANLFPDRIRVLAIDGVLDPLAWAGRPATADVPMTARLLSGAGAWGALKETFARCSAAGESRCALADEGMGRVYARVAERLKAHPVDLGDGEVITYAALVSVTLSYLYGPNADVLVEALQFLDAVTDPSATAAGRATAAARAGALVRAERARVAALASRYGYDNSAEAFQSVVCTDSLNPRNLQRWVDEMPRQDRVEPYFGRLWTWLSSPCATRDWTATDEDAYRGGFTARTSATVLVVGTQWDPATYVGGAVTAARLLPNSRLLLSDNWGHTSYGTSECATTTMDAYLLDGRVPAAGAFCHAPDQPFGVSAAASRGGFVPRPMPMLPLRW